MHGSFPNRNGPPLCFRHSSQMATMRSAWACVSGRSAFCGYCWTIFIEQSFRRFAKPECISAATDLARARCAASLGQSRFSGNFSCRYSEMASESQTVTFPSISAGTRPLGEYLRMLAAVSGMSRATTISSNGTPACLSTSQGRSDHEEYFLLPTTIFSMRPSVCAWITGSSPCRDRLYHDAARGKFAASMADKNLLDEIARGIVVFDGAMGTTLQ